MKNKKMNQKKQYKWLILPQMYFLCVQKLCDCLIQKIVHGQYLYEEKEEGMNYYEKLEYSNMIIPIVYNLKHGIELYLKGVGYHIKYGTKKFDNVKTSKIFIKNYNNSILF